MRSCILAGSPPPPRGGGPRGLPTIGLRAFCRFPRGVEDFVINVALSAVVGRVGNRGAEGEVD